MDSLFRRGNDQCWQDCEGEDDTETCSTSFCPFCVQGLETMPGERTLKIAYHCKGSKEGEDGETIYADQAAYSEWVQERRKQYEEYLKQQEEEGQKDE
jgi:hypothetical protein